MVPYSSDREERITMFSGEKCTLTEGFFVFLSQADDLGMSFSGSRSLTRYGWLKPNIKFPRYRKVSFIYRESHWMKARVPEVFLCCSLGVYVTLLKKTSLL